MEFSCEKLDIYKISRKFILEIYKLAEEFPASEKFGLTSQIKRSSVSISLNIAEGSGKATSKDFANFIRIAIGSLIETDTSLKIAVDLGFIKKEDYHKIDETIKELYFKLIGFHKYLKNKK